MGSLRGFGQVAPILIDKRNVVVDGHALLMAAERLGFKEVPVIRLDHLAPQQVQACRVTLNKLQEGAEWDLDALRVELLEIAPTLEAFDIEIEALGFTPTAFDLQTAPAQAASAGDEPPLPPVEAAIRALAQDLRRTKTLAALLNKPWLDKEARFLAQSSRFESGQVYVPQVAP
jgi:ParB-like chromosome segregation protein Spo0J